MGEGAGVDDVLWTKPTFAGEGDPEIEEAEVRCFMGVGVDAAEDAQVPSFVPPAPVEIKPPRISIQFNPRSVGRGRVKNLWNVERIGLPLEKKPAGGVPEAGDMLIFDGTDDAIGHLLFIRGKSGVDRGDHVIQFLKERIGKIEFSAFENIALRSRKESTLRFLRVEDFDLFDLFFQAFGVQAVGLERGFGVIGNAQPLEPQFGGGLRHGGESILPVAGQSVIVEASADLIARQEIRQLIFFRGGDFPAIFAKFGGDEGKTQRPVKIFFVFEFEGSFRFSFEQTPFTEVEALVDGALAKRNIVLLGASKVGEGRRPGFGGNDAEIAGDASRENDTGFGFAVGDNFFHVGRGNKDLHDFLGLIGGGDQIEIFHDLFAAAKTSGDFGLVNGWASAEVSQKRLGRGQGCAEAVKFAVGGAALNGIEQVGGGFFAEAVESGEAAVLAGLGQGFEGFNF